MSLFPRLLADIGGTNARFAWQAGAGAGLAHVHSSPCADHDALTDAIRHYLQRFGLPVPAACGIGIANPVLGDQVRMTNHHWSFSIEALRRTLGLARLVVINDFTAEALSLPLLPAADLHRLGGLEPVEGAPRAVLGPGTGLGVSGLLSPSARLDGVIMGEGGHVTLAAADDEEAAVLSVLRRRFGHVSAERAVSGPGLVNLYEAVAQIQGRASEALAPADVMARARAGSDPACREALSHFCAFLGGVAGNLALTLGARGGVYIAGGIAPRILGEMAASRLRERFEGKGRFQDYLAPVPIFVVTSTVPTALLGVSRALDDAS